MDSFEDPFEGKVGVYQFTMRHLESGLLFREDADYVFGVNAIALATLEHDIQVLCYTLMSNHLHLLLQGTFSHCQQAYLWLCRRLRRMINTRYGQKGIPDPDDYSVTAVNSHPVLQNEVLYLVRNGYRARIASPLSYRWSSADCYFNLDRDLIHGVRFDTLSTQEQKDLLHSHTRVPGDWEHIGGRILNRCFVAWRKVERCFENSLNYFDKLRLWDLESAVKRAHGVAETIRFTDQELQDRVTQLCRKEYHVDAYQQLENKDLLMLARNLARRYAAGKAQISRVLNIRQDVLDKVL